VPMDIYILRECLQQRFIAGKMSQRSQLNL
jgi:hypothetical protein